MCGKRPVPEGVSVAAIRLRSGGELGRDLLGEPVAPFDG